MQTTSQTWHALLASGAPLQARATIGGVAYTDISAPVITRALMQDRLSVGNVVSASLALAVRGAVNIPRSAAVVVEVRLNDGQTASEWLPQGTFYISRRMRDPVTGLLALECYDALLKANAVWTPTAGTWPRTMAAVTTELAALLGVTLDSRTVIPTGAAYAMSEPAEGTTIRDVLGVVAQAAGGNWVMTPAGLLRLVRVGESGDTVDVTGVVGGIDVGQAGTVTGVRSTVDGAVTLIGDDTGIVVDVSIAPMIAAEMAEDLIGQAYAPFHLSGAIYDPAAELGDGVRAGAGGEVISALCSEQAAYGPAFRGDIAAPDPGEVTDEYPYIGSAERTLALAKAAAVEAVDRLDDELTQQEIFNRLTDDGAAQGLLLYNGQLYINASYINAGYLNANHIQGGTLTLGGQGNQNGVLQVLDASGNVITVLNNAGADITNGSLTTYSTDRQTRTILSDGLLKFQFYNSAVQPIGWRDALRLAADPQSATIGTFAGIAELDISGRGRVKIKNKDSITDPDYAEIDMDDDSVLLTATRNDGVMEWASLQVTKDGVTVSKQDTTGDPYVLFELAAGQSRKPLSIGNGGTGATTAANARTNLGVTPANIGAVAKSGDTMTGQLNLIPAGLEGGQILLGASSDHPEYAGINIDQVGPSLLRIFGQPSDDGTSITGVGTPLEINPYAKTITGGYTFTGNVTGNAANVTGTVQIDHGGTGATTPAGARANLEITPANIGAVSTSDTLDIAHGGTGKTTNWEGLAALSTPRVNTTWKDAPVGVSVFKYEGDTSSFDVPALSFVVVIKENNARGVAYAIRWAGPSTALWISYLHDDSGQNNWSGWKTIVDLNGAVPVTSGGTNATTPAQARANLEITPANIGAVAKSGDTMTGMLTFESGNGLSWTANSGTQYVLKRNDPYDVVVLFVNGPNTSSTWKPALAIGSDGSVTLSNALDVPYGGTGANSAAGARTNLGIATTVTTVTTTGITSHGNWISDLNPNNVVIDAAYCTAGTVAVTPYCNSGGKWAFHCIDVSTGAAYGTAFDLTIRYHNIY